jgi:hypothetical protein
MLLCNVSYYPQLMTMILLLNVQLCPIITRLFVDNFRAGISLIQLKNWFLCTFADWFLFEPNKLCLSARRAIKCRLLTFELFEFLIFLERGIGRVVAGNF